MDANAGSLYKRFTALKNTRPGLQAWIAIGGWSFNDATNVPDTRHAFSDMVSTPANRQAFIGSLLNFMQTYGFDGVDLDWEYPVADDRGGVPADFAKFPIFLAELRAALGPGRGVSVTLPSSYWYLQHFDLLAMQPHIDWFNVMSYDIHGVWDSANKFTGPYIRPHTNLTEIEDGLSLLWRAGVGPAQVVLGLGWYGRSFTLRDPSCDEPNGACRFTAGGAPGECSRSAGTLTNAEIKRVMASNPSAVESYDATAGVRWLRWDTNQWVSYDDGITSQQKIAMANRLCLGGIMIVSLPAFGSLPRYLSVC
jgi:GH18 family chitinase